MQIYVKKISQYPKYTSNNNQYYTEKSMIVGTTYIIFWYLLYVIFDSAKPCIYSINLFIDLNNIWGIERSGFFNGRGKWAKGFENQRV